MFTGIVQTALPITKINKKNLLHELVLDFPNDLVKGVQLGASIALNGTCLTVANIDKNCIQFDVMMETLRVTNLADLNDESLVNIERAAKFGDEIGGHVLSGHVHAQAELVDIQTPENNYRLMFKVPEQWQKYIFPKGFVAVNGASLTIGEVESGCFSVYLIPETLRITNFGKLGLGDKVNLEVDAHTQAIVDTLERMKEAGKLT